MIKQELCKQIVEDMWKEDLLNEADAYNTSSLKQEVEKLLSRHLEDYVFVWKTGIIDD